VKRNDDKWLDDSVATIADVVCRGWSAFDQDVAVRRAGERFLELVGEDANFDHR
jgi:hypothetical protein